MKRQKYASDISREKFAEIEPELRQVRSRTKPATLEHGISALERALRAANTTPQTAGLRLKRGAKLQAVHVVRQG